MKGKKLDKMGEEKKLKGGRVGERKADGKQDFTQNWKKEPFPQEPGKPTEIKRMKAEEIKRPD